MYIKKINIVAFGGVRDLTLDLIDGLNIIEGKNESGKSSVAMFIKFIFYGLSGRGTDGALSERKRYVNWETGSAQGSIILERGGRDYKIERELYVSVSDTGVAAAEAVRERTVVTDAVTGERMFNGQVPGAALLGMPETMFCNSVFVRQLTDAKIDGTGMAEAIENIMYSGDESVSTRRAAEKLDKCRISLLHKNGSGGRIYELQKQRAKLTAALDDARAKNAEIMELETAVADSAALIEAREGEAARLSEILSARETLDAAAELDELEKLEREENRLRVLIESYPARDATEAACEEMRRTAMERGETELKLKALRLRITSLDRSLPPLPDEGEKEKERSMAADAAVCEKRKKSAFGFSLAFFILAAVCAAGGAFLTRIDTTITAAAFAGAGIMAAAGAVLLALSLRTQKKYAALLLHFGAADAKGAAQEAEARITRAELMRGETSEFADLAREETQAEAARAELISAQRILAVQFTADEPDTDTMTEKALARAGEMLRETAAYTREYDTVSGKLSMFRTADAAERENRRKAAAEVLESDAGKAAAALNTAQREKLLRDRGFYMSTAEAQRKRHTELEKRLSLLSANAASPSGLAAEAAALDTELEAANAKLRAINGAMDALEAAGGRLRASLLPRIVSEAGALLGAFTGGKYTGLGVSRNFDVSYTPGDRTREGDFMSAGTRDAAYISLRCSLMRVLFEGDAPPAIYDESFARIDEPRLARLLDILRAAGEEGAQSLVFTCRSLEGRVTDGRVPHIKL